MKTFQAYASFFTTFAVYLFICVCCGIIAQSLAVFGISPTSFSLSSQGNAVVVGNAQYAGEKHHEEYDDYWRCPNCGGLVNPELDTCGCGFNR